MPTLDELKKQYRIEARIEQLPALDRYAAYDLWPGLFASCSKVVQCVFNRLALR